MTRQNGKIYGDSFITAKEPCPSVKELFAKILNIWIDLELYL